MTMGGFLLTWLLASYLFSSCQGQTIKFLLVTESAQPELNSKFTDGLKQVQDTNAGSTFEVEAINFTRKFADTAYEDLCSILNSNTFTAVIDMAWGGWIKGRKVGWQMTIPYVRVEVANHPFVKAVDDYLTYRDSIDAALIFPTKVGLDQSLYYIIGNSALRIIGGQLEDAEALNRLQKMRPRPSNYIAWGTQDDLTNIYKQAKTKDMIKRDSKWTLVDTSFSKNEFPTNDLLDWANFMTITEDTCCPLLGKTSGNCDCSSIKIPEEAVKNSAIILGQAALDMAKSGKPATQKYSCNINGTTNQTRNDFESFIKAKVEGSTYYALKDKHQITLLTPPIKLKVEILNKDDKTSVGQWDPLSGFKPEPGYEMKKVKRFFRVGVVLAEPWAFVDNSPNSTSIQSLNDSLVDKGLTGYCIELLRELSSKMDFDYEIRPSSKNQYGHKLNNGSWTGLVGDLISGEIDISVATLTMTTEREEVIDFVSPYFDQSGISILLRKEEPEQNFFKFMKVLKEEVWLGILCAVIVVAILIWILDRFSPFSYHNNKEAYPEGARDFTLGESIWFALTSLTPQGGGECPKALSARVLVAAYWLFIVLMLATFTANLAAFLTVERMQTTVQSLEELARQSKINYTTTANSPYLQYFENMAGAEDELYRKWKEITLNRSSDQSKYRVWDYPVKEQYTHIFNMIVENGPVESSEEGYRRVEEAKKGTFAFIYDASEVKYQYYKNCDFMEVGEPFAEQPLAVAVQQGSHLQKEISRAILTLQKERFFENLTQKYWNTTIRNNCPVVDDSKGITIQSLGGIFIATLGGLILSMITLAFEVWQQKKQEKNNQVSEISPGAINVMIGNKNIQMSAAGNKSSLSSFKPMTNGYMD